MLSAILVKDSNPTGVTERTAVLAASKPPTRRSGSNTPRTSISGPKMSAMELRYSPWVNRLRLTTSELAAAIAGAALTAMDPEASNAVERTEAKMVRMRKSWAKLRDVERHSLVRNAGLTARAITASFHTSVYNLERRIYRW